MPHDDVPGPARSTAPPSRGLHDGPPASRGPQSIPPKQPPPEGALALVPGLAALRGYRWRDLRSDVVAGLVLTAFMVPVGVGYAQASGLPPITGLYATMIPLVIYAVLGPSRVLVLGPDSSLSAVIAAVVGPLAAGDPSRAVALAAMLSVLVGVGIALTGLLKLGFVTELLSRPVQLGYLTGVALMILVGQTPKLLGFSVKGDGLAEEGPAILRAALSGAIHLPSLAIGASTIVWLVLAKRFVPKVPAALVAVVAGTLVTWLLQLDERGVRVLGALPRGLPPLGFPEGVLRDVPQLVAGALSIALIAVADTTVLSHSLATARREEVDPDRELVALGAACVGAGLVSGFPVSASTSRTPVAIAAGARTQVTGVVGALAIGALLVLAPDLLADLPQPVLAGIVLVAAWNLVDKTSVHKLYRASRPELGLGAVSFLGVAFLGVIQGIFIGIVLSLGDFVRRAWRPHDAVLGRVDDMKGYHDLKRYPSARRIPGLVLYRFDAPLFFANAPYFRDRVRELFRDSNARWLIVAAEPITDIDSTAAGVLQGMLDELGELGLTLAFAELKDPVKDRLRRHELYDRIGADRFFPTLGTAVDAYVEASGVHWEDWDERESAPPSE